MTDDEILAEAAKVLLAKCDNEPMYGCAEGYVVSMSANQPSIMHSYGPNFLSAPSTDIELTIKVINPTPETYNYLMTKYGGNCNPGFEPPKVIL